MPLPDQTPKLPKLPFLVGDLALIATAWLIARDSPEPLPTESTLIIVGCVAFAAIIGVIPFLSDYAHRQNEALDDRQRSLEAIARTVAASAEQIGIATRGLQQKTEQLESAAEKIAAAIAEGSKVEATVQKRAAGKERKRAVSAEEENPEVKEAESQILTNSATSEELVESPAPVVETSAPAAEPVAPASPAPKPPRKPRAPRPKQEPAEVKQAEPDLGIDEPILSPDVSQADPAENAPVDALASDGATRLLVTAYIGIGNRLFVRGDGPGLSWDKGVPLQFVSIGKWRWEAENASAPIALKLYKNDETECVALGQLELQPGHQQEISARF
jgi:hypothetical protein